MTSISSPIYETILKSLLNEVVSLIEVYCLNKYQSLYGITMKKTFDLTQQKLPMPRAIEAIKYEVKKYLKRERNKPLPEGVDFWGFDCRFGVDEATSDVIHVSAINKCISEAEVKELESFYLEVLAKSGHRTKKPIE